MRGGSRHPSPRLDIREVEADGRDAEFEHRSGEAEEERMPVPGACAVRDDQGGPRIRRDLGVDGHLDPARRQPDRDSLSGGFGGHHTPGAVDGPPAAGVVLGGAPPSTSPGSLSGISPGSGAGSPATATRSPYRG